MSARTPARFMERGRQHLPNAVRAAPELCDAFPRPAIVAAAQGKSLRKVWLAKVSSSAVRSATAVLESLLVRSGKPFVIAPPRASASATMIVEANKNASGTDRSGRDSGHVDGLFGKQPAENIAPSQNEGDGQNRWPHPRSTMQHKGNNREKNNVSDVIAEKRIEFATGEQEGQCRSDGEDVT